MSRRRRSGRVWRVRQPMPQGGTAIDGSSRLQDEPIPAHWRPNGDRGQRSVAQGAWRGILTFDDMSLISLAVRCNWKTTLAVRIRVISALLRTLDCPDAPLSMRAAEVLMEIDHISTKRKQAASAAALASIEAAPVGSGDTEQSGFADISPEIAATEANDPTVESPDPEDRT